MMQALYKNTWNWVLVNFFSLTQFCEAFGENNYLVLRGVFFSLDLNHQRLLPLHHLQSELLPCWFLTFRLFDFLMLHLVDFTCSAASESLSHSTHIAGTASGNMFFSVCLDTSRQTRKSYTHSCGCMKADTSSAVHLWFDLISIVNYVPVAIFTVFWVYLLQVFSMFLCNQITLQGSNLLRADWKILQGEITLLRDDFQVLFCHHHELNILF